MSYSFCDADEVEATHGVFRPIRRALGGQAFGINQEDLPPNGDGYPDHTEVESGQEEIFYVLAGSGRITVDGEDVQLKPGRYVLVTPESTRKVWPGPDGVKLIVVGAPVGRGYEVPS